MKTHLLLLTCLLLFLSCSKNDNQTNGKVINSIIQPVIEISNGDTLKINLGNFGDEEGAWVFKNPKNAEISSVYRQSSSVIYKYFPKSAFTGKDTVVFILNRGSDGASSGRNDTTTICIIVK